LRSWFLLILLSCIWGSSFMLMKKGMYTADGKVIFSDTQVAALRMFLASVVLSPFALTRMPQKAGKGTWISLIAVGFFGNFIPAFLFTYAETELSSGFTGMLNSCTPVFTVVLGAILFSSFITLRQGVGIVIGTIGIFLLVNAGADVSYDGGWKFVLAVVTATLCYAISLNTIKHRLGNFSALSISSVAFLLLLIPSTLAVIFTGVHHTLYTHPEAWSAFFFISLLALFGTAISVVLFNNLIASSSALFASSVTYFIPVVAVIIGFFLKEDLTWKQIASMMIVLLGVFVMNYQRGGGENNNNA
jgi:drug/metabolite transporter (DMT)-like permease